MQEVIRATKVASKRTLDVYPVERIEQEGITAFDQFYNLEQIQAYLNHLDQGDTLTIIVMVVIIEKMLLQDTTLPGVHLHLLDHMTYENRSLHALSICLPPADNCGQKPAIFILGGKFAKSWWTFWHHYQYTMTLYLHTGIHCREWISPAVNLYLINQLVTMYKAGVRHLFTPFNFKRWT